MLVLRRFRHRDAVARCCACGCIELRHDEIRERISNSDRLNPRVVGFVRFRHDTGGVGHRNQVVDPRGCGGRNLEVEGHRVTASSIQRCDSVLENWGVVSIQSGIEGEVDAGCRRCRLRTVDSDRLSARIVGFVQFKQGFFAVGHHNQARTLVLCRLRHRDGGARCRGCGRRERRHNEIRLARVGGNRNCRRASAVVSKL